MGVKNYSPGSEVVLYEGVVWSLEEAGTGDAENICELATIPFSSLKRKLQKTRVLTFSRFRGPIHHLERRTTEIRELDWFLFESRDTRGF